MNNIDVHTMFSTLVDRVEAYYRVYRASIVGSKIALMEKCDPEYSYDPTDETIREGLVEHVGSLPIIATTIYPWLNRDDIDLGDALIMLAIHDIGETELGDIFSFDKKTSDYAEEREVALRILPSSLHEHYCRMLDLAPEDVTAQFAKSIDKLAPSIINVSVPIEFAMQRISYYLGSDNPNVAHERKLDHELRYMTWDTKMQSLYEHIVETYHTRMLSHSASR